MDFPTRPEGISAAANQLTVLRMEIGDRATYEICARDGRYLPIRLHVGQTLFMKSYLPELGLDICFVRRPPAPAGYRPRMPSFSESVRPTFTRIKELPIGRLLPTEDGERIRLGYVGIETLGQRNLKQLLVQPYIQLPVAVSPWVLELGFENFPNQPRVLYPFIPAP